MFGWFKNDWIFNSRVNCSVIYSYNNNRFYMIFNAQMKFVFLSRAKKTCPYFPEPRSLIFSKSFIVIFLYFFLFQEFLTH